MKKLDGNGDGKWYNVRKFHTVKLKKHIHSYSTCKEKSILRSNKKKIRVGENGDLDQSKHQNCTIQITRFFFN
jgi:hypothetical protein